MPPVLVPDRAHEPRSPSDPLAAFVQRHRAWVWRYLVFLGCEPSLAEDLTQETFVAVLGRQSEIVPRAQRSYLRRTAHSLFVRAHRHRRALPLADEHVAEVAFDVFCGSDDGDSYLDALRLCLAELEPRQREALDALYAQELPRAEVGRRLKLSEGGIKSLLRRTYARLRNCVERRLA